MITTATNILAAFRLALNCPIVLVLADAGIWEPRASVRREIAATISRDFQNTQTYTYKYIGDDCEIHDGLVSSRNATEHGQF